MPQIVHFLGPEGTFAHAATLSAFGRGATLVPGKTVLAVFEAVTRHAPPTAEPSISGEHLGVVPIENSIEGSVSLTLEALTEPDAPRITGEIIVEVEQCLLGSGTLEQVRSVASHPHALAQCKRWLHEHLPDAERVTTPSTAAAAEMVAGKPEQAAIASALAARCFDLNVLCRGIQDRPHNATRFIVLGHHTPAATGADKTSIVFDAPHERGALHRILGIFDQHDVNLSRIESRPLAGEMWRYVFFADLEGHQGDANVAAALTQLANQGRSLRVLGSFPRATVEAPTSSPPAAH